MSFLPRFVTPGDVRDLKNRLDPSVRAIDAALAQRCPILPEGTRAAWSDFSNAWRAYFKEDDSWLHTAAQYDAGEAYERQIADWQRAIGASCTVPGPKITAPDTTSGALSSDTQSTIRTVAIAGVVIAACLTLRTAIK